MASGDAIGGQPITTVAGGVTAGIIGTPVQLSYLLLDAVDVSGAQNGVWVDCREYISAVVAFSGIATLAIITIEGNNDLVRPGNGTHGSALGNNTAGTNSPAITVTSLPRWLKAHLTTLGTGTVTVTATLRGSAQT